jgi:hypothetical protein
VVTLERRNLVIIIASVIIVAIGVTYYYTVILHGSSKIDFEVSINPINTEDLTVNEWLDDFEHLYEFVKNNYPYLSVKERTHGYNWLELKDEFENRIMDAQDNKEFLSILMEIMQALQNRHTEVSHPSRVIENQAIHENWEPFNKVFSQEVSDAAAYWMDIYNDCQMENTHRRFEVLIVYNKGNYVIKQYDSSWENMYGNYTIVKEVNGVPIDEVVKTCYDSGYLDYDFKREKNYLWSITPMNFGDNAVFTLLNSTGHTWEQTFVTKLGSVMMPYVYPSSLLNLTKFEDLGIAYIYMGDFGSRGKEYIDDLQNFYPEIEDYEYLIIDIRGNTGGFFQVWIDGIVSPLIKDKLLFEYYTAYRTDEYVLGLQRWLNAEILKDEFETLPPEVYSSDFKIFKAWQTFKPQGEADFNGEVIVLIDNMVYSASEGFCYFGKNYEFATFYGTPSGGDGLMIYPLYYVLPNSKLVVEFASSLGLDSSGYANEEVRTQPDVYYESEYGNNNELINFVINDLVNRSQ